MSLRLRKITTNDLEQIMKWRISPEVTKYMYTDPVLTLESQTKWLESIQKRTNEKYWIIEIDNISIGVLSLNDIDLINNRCYWAYYIGDTSFRGRGIARLLECNVYDYVFDFLSLNKLCCEVFTFNEAVVSIHQKFGSEIEGIFKQHIWKDGVYYDIACMAMNKEKWLKIRPEYKYDKIEIE